MTAECGGEIASLDDAPWTQEGQRYPDQVSPYAHFKPRPGYSQNREDYPA